MTEKHTLVERLRKNAEWVEAEFDIVDNGLLTEAADTIERLMEALQAALPIIASDYERGSPQFQPIAPDAALAMIRAALGQGEG